MKNSDSGLKKNLAENIRHFRKEKQLTQFEFAELCGVNENTMRAIEQSNVWPKTDTLEKIILALQIKPYELFKPSDVVLYESQDVERCIDVNLDMSLKNIVNELNNGRLPEIAV